MKVVRFWNSVVNYQWNVVPVLQGLKRRMLVEIDDSVKMIRITDFDCCESLKELIFHQAIHSHEKIKNAFRQNRTNYPFNRRAIRCKNRSRRCPNCRPKCTVPPRRPHMGPVEPANCCPNCSPNCGSKLFSIQYQDGADDDCVSHIYNERMGGSFEVFPLF
jgi:hypothetical protein